MSAPALLSSAVARAFAEDGPIAKAVPEFEPRPGQREMALAVADAFEQGGQILVEAGTGTGKTLAYLVPAILGRQRVLVSTGTKNLQEQIYFKDLPVLADVLGVRFTATYMKGRANYLCRQRLDLLRERRPGPAADPLLVTVIEWAGTTGTGDRAELGDLPEDLSLWDEIAATRETCVGANCPHDTDCFVTRMRQRAAESDIVIVNHHLLCADAAVRQGNHGQVIPACAYAVVDEAHQLEDVATQYFGMSVSNYRVEDLCRDGEGVLGAPGLGTPARVPRRGPRLGTSARVPRRGPRPGTLGPEETSRGQQEETPQRRRQLEPADVLALSQSLEHLRDCGRVFFVGLQFGRMARTPEGGAPGGEDRARLTSEFLAEHAEAGIALVGALDQLESTSLSVKDPGEDLLTIGRRAGELRDELRFLLRAGDPDYVYYLEIRGRGVFLRASPIEVSSIVRTQVLDRFQAVVLTSATLSVGGSFDYIRSRLGVGASQELRLPSEFDFERQAILYLPPRMPDPRSPGFAEAASQQIVEILRRTRGRAFVLFTSYAVLRTVQPIIESALDFPVLVQGTAPRSILLQEFRTTPHAVLLATSSFWQGVDVIGEALSCVIVDKLPFASPADPITSARVDAIARRGGEPFWEYTVPLAILTLQQGLGRLIRHRRDRGVLSVLDPRLRTKGYGRAFLEALPQAPVTSDIDAISRFLDERGRE
jgi:ATP-dependent DNA helicase DinG